MSRNKSDLSSFCSFMRILKMNYISGFYRKGFRWRHYGVAVLTVAIALLLKLLLAPLIDHESPFLVFFAAVIVSAWYGGMGAGVLATAVSALFSNYFFLEPTYSFIHYSFGQNLRLVHFKTLRVAYSTIDDQGSYQAHSMLTQI